MLPFFSVEQSCELTGLPFVKKKRNDGDIRVLGPNKKNGNGKGAAKKKFPRCARNIYHPTTASKNDYSNDNDVTHPRMCGTKESCAYQ